MSAASDHDSPAGRPPPASTPVSASAPAPGENPTPESTPALTPTPTSQGRARWVALGVFALALAVRLPLLPALGFPPDQAQFVQWSQTAEAQGVSGLYAQEINGRPRCNYPPLYVYALRGLAAIHRAGSGEPPPADLWRDVYRGSETEPARRAIILHKLPATLADALLGAALVIWLGRRLSLRQAALVGAAYVLMPTVIHNSAVWGQIDAIPTALVLASLELARRRKLTAMWAVATVAMLTKAQALVFAPIWLVVTIVSTRAAWRSWLRYAGTVTVICIATALPIQDQLSSVSKAYTGAAARYPHVHLNGFSAWFLMNPIERPQLALLDNFYARDDRPLAIGLTPRTLGLLALVCAWLACARDMWRHRCDDRSLRRAARILPLAFFVLSTQMHERYAFPVLAAWAWAYTPSRAWWAGWMVLGACTLGNALWVFAGPGDGSIVTGLRDGLWTTWLGIRPGIWISLTFIVVFVLQWSGPRRSGALIQPLSGPRP